MKVLVFGGSGFLGSYVVEELKDKEHQVFVADIKNNGFDKSNFFSCDILNKNRVEEIVREGFDVVYNFAGFANLDKAVNEPYKTLSLNILGNLNILEACQKNNVGHYIFASSAYAMNTKGSFYGVSKLASEKVIEEYHRKLGINFTIIRYGSIYSEKPAENNYLYNLVLKAVETKTINHAGDGEEIREYIHAHDAASLSVKILEDPTLINQHLILTGFEKMKRIQLFQMIKEILGEDIKINLLKSNNTHHYFTTPYEFHPTLSKKLIANPYIDMGQGILEIIRRVKEETEE